MRARRLIAISGRGLSGGDPRGAAINDLSLDVMRGQVTVVCGGPGSGKTTLLRTLAGLDRPRAGTVRIGERRIDAAPGRPAWRFRRDELAFVGEARVPRRSGGRGELIVRALAPEPELVFIDEPADGLAPSELDRVHGALQALTAIRGRTAVVATRDPRVAGWAHRLIGLDHGALIMDLDSPSAAEARHAARALSA